MDIIAARTLNTLYIYLDVAWLIIFVIILVYHKRYLALTAGAIGGVIYFTVDYGIFYLGLSTRVVSGADPFWFLLWLSLSYGLTNIAWIWLLLDRDNHATEWSVLIIAGWIAIAFISQNFGSSFPIVSIQRGTATYHGVMALLLIAGYLYLIIRNFQASIANKVNILWLIAIGIGIQFSWEFILLISNIRPMGFLPLIANSLIETNLGMPYLYLIHKAISSRYNESMERRVK